MSDDFESDLDELDSEMFKYLGITNLDFRKSLSDLEMEEVKNIIFSINTLAQITFREGTNIKDVENIKYMIELSPTCDDKKIEKLILKNIPKEEINLLLTMPFENPDTWHLSYEVENDTFMLTSLPNFRKMEEYINIVLSCIKDDMTQLEKIKEVYDFVKLLEIDEEASYRLPEIILKRKTNSLGFNILLKKILERIDIKTYIGEVLRDNNKEYISLININDDKYDGHGIYIFDPYSDSIPKNIYKIDAFRKLNYNFFCLSLDEFMNMKEQDKLLSVLKYLNSDSLDYAERNVDDKDKNNLNDIFDLEFSEVFEKFRKTKKIKDDKLINLIISTVHKDDFLDFDRDYNELLTSNYKLRKEELFKKEVEDIPTVCIHDV